MKKIKNSILIFSSEFPPNPGGIGNHSYNLAVNLSENNYELTVLSDSRNIKQNREFEFDSTLGYSVIRVKLRKPRFLMALIGYTNSLNIKKSNIIIASGKFPIWICGFCSIFFKKNIFQSFMARK